ncbi:larval cuticle protein A1A-like [Aricia agestis]|uniref:larval cuticle protein A1A-like n=1 Tax=Aricia agestis TaxID=91739 RepID=UPI001C207661|nr:larval cuticle protein A1A-like [Aricia agestis]
MAAKFLMILSLAAAARGGVPGARLEYPDEPAHYEYQYSVSDASTGDSKQQQEARAGDSVSGSYSLLQPDGLTRHVRYSADALAGFNAEVTYEGAPAPANIAYAAPAAKVAYSAPISYAAPVAKVAYSAPISYAAPVAKVAYSAPISYAAPVAKVAYSSPISYSAPLSYAAPVAKVSYASPLSQVSFASPAVSYHH